MVLDLLDFATAATDRDWLSKNIDRDKVDAEKVIDLLSHKAGWRWYNSFKTTRDLNFRVSLNNGTLGNWRFTLTLTKNTAGNRQLASRDSCLSSHSFVAETVMVNSPE